MTWGSPKTEGPTIGYFDELGYWEADDSVVLLQSESGPMQLSYYLFVSSVNVAVDFQPVKIATIIEVCM